MKRKLSRILVRAIGTIVLSQLHAARQCEEYPDVADLFETYTGRRYGQLGSRVKNPKISLGMSWSNDPTECF